MKFVVMLVLLLSLINISFERRKIQKKGNKGKFSLCDSSSECASPYTCKFYNVYGFNVCK